MNNIVKILRAFAFVSLSLNALVYGLDILHMVTSLTSFAALGEVFHFGILFMITGGLAAWAAPYVFKDVKQLHQRRTAEQAQRGRQQSEQLARWRHEAPIREQNIRANYDNKLNFVRYESPLLTETDQIKEMNEFWKKEMYVNVTMSLRFVLSRAFASMSTSDIEVCRYSELFRTYDLISNEDYCRIMAGLVYNGGACQQQVYDYFLSRGFKDKNSINNESDAVRYVINRWNAGSPEVCKALFFSTFSTIQAQFSTHPLVSEFRSKVLAGSNSSGERDREQQQHRATEQAGQRQRQAEELVRWKSEAPMREQKIKEIYDNKMNFIRFESGPITETDQIKEMDELLQKETYIDITMSVRFVLSRALASMSTGEIEICRYLELFRTYDLMSYEDFCLISAGLAYDGGACQQQVHDYFVSRGFKEKHSINSESDAVRYVINRWNAGSPEASKALFFRKFSIIAGGSVAHPDQYSQRQLALVSEFQSKVVAGSNWLSEDDASSIFSDWLEGDGGLFLGRTDSGRLVGFREQGSLITIAPPGSGKTQCHVITNLLTYRGPVVVLDVKGECYDNTAAWRKKNVGPVFKFSPLDPKSNHYNPLAFISKKPDLIWKECSLMADLLIVPENSHDRSWEERARDVVAGAIAWVVRMDVPEEQRSMGKIVDVVSKVGWSEFIASAKDAHMVPPLRRLGNALADMPDVTLGGVLSAARRHLKVWEGSLIERVTGGKCDWRPEDLRSGKNPTIYICIPPNEIEYLAPLLRVLFAQHLRVLMDKLPKNPGPPILFMLDELPRLGHMQPVAEALEAGRGYGIKLWMFAQSLGQLANAYPNAEGMIGSCKVRIFLNPSAHDGTAKRLSEELGYVESIIDGSRHLLIEPTELAGPEYKDYQVVLGTNEKPLKLKKLLADKDDREDGFMKRMAIKEGMESALEAGS